MVPSKWLNHGNTPLRCEIIQICINLGKTGLRNSKAPETFLMRVVVKADCMGILDGTAPWKSAIKWSRKIILCAAQ